MRQRYEQISRRQRRRKMSTIEHVYKVQRQLEVDLVGPEGGVPQALGRLHRLGESYRGGLQR